jgi:hypothetical protein
MLSRPEPQTFTKFMVSMGVFLCLAAFVAPAVALRNDGVLLISQRRAAELTPVGRAEVLHRQNIEHDLVGRFAIPFGALLFACGCLLLYFALPGLRNDERLEREHSHAKLLKTVGELEPRSEDEREAKGREAEAELGAVGLWGAEADPHRAVSEGGQSLQSPGTAESPPRPGPIARARQAEDEVVARLVQIVPPVYKMRAQVRLGDDTGFDAVLLSEIDQLPDVVVEIKYSRWGGVDDSVTSRWVSHAGEMARRYESRTGRLALAWLILVVMEPVDLPAMRQTTADKVEELNGLVRFSIVRADDVSNLSLPDLQAR